MIWEARLILLVIVLLNFHFQKCRDPNPLLDPVGGSKLEPGLLRRFQSKHLFCLIKFSFSKVSRPESPTRPERRIRTGARFTPTFSIIFPKHVVYVILFWTFLIKRKHFFSGNPMTIYKFKRPITFTNNTCIYKYAFISTCTHAIHFRMLSIYKSFTISYHAFSMQQFISKPIHEI